MAWPRLSSLDEDTLWRYLRAYNHQFLYQKVGFFASLQPPLLPLSTSLIEACKSRIGDSSRYLSSTRQGESTYEETWQLMIPRKLLHAYGWSIV